MNLNPKPFCQITWLSYNYLLFLNWVPNWTSIKIEWCINWIPGTLGPPKEITQETKVQFPFVSPTPIISQTKRKGKRHGNPPQPKDQTIKSQHNITFHCLLVVFVHKRPNSFSWIRILVATLLWVLSKSESLLGFWSSSSTTCRRKEKKNNGQWH